MIKRGRKNATPLERLESRVAKRGECWEWTASRDKDGYGLFCLAGATSKAHRASWILFKGSIPSGLSVLHECDNRGCVNPDHLFLGTQLDNMRDCRAKNRHARLDGKKNGHRRLTEEEVIKIRSGVYDGVSCDVIAERLGVWRTTIYDVINGTTWPGVNIENQSASQ